jgi:predicted P-loop ATPase
VHTIAREHSFHPIREYLDSLKWDGTKRINNWLTLYLGTEPSEYARAVGAKFLIGGVARIYKPGVGKHLKSSAISKLPAAQQRAVVFEAVTRSS